MWLVFLLFIFILGIIFSTIEANLYKLEVTDKKLNLKLVVSLKWFGLVRILYANFNGSGIKFLNKKISYKELILKVKEDDLNIDVLSLDMLDMFKLKKMNFVLKIGLIEMALTNIVVVVLSSIFPIFVKSIVKKRNVKYSIFPEYNKFYICLNGRISLSVKSLSIIKLYFKNIKPQITHNKSKNCDVKESC